MSCFAFVTKSENRSKGKGKWGEKQGNVNGFWFWTFLGGFSLPSFCHKSLSYLRVFTLDRCYM